MSEKYQLPWHRVIRADGFIALESGSGKEEQTRLLRGEGVEVTDNGWVDLGTYGYGRK
jgi:methylated-DNA-protein-cysteine methyltransferase-like protein